MSPGRSRITLKGPPAVGRRSLRAFISRSSTYGYSMQNSGSVSSSFTARGGGYIIPPGDKRTFGQVIEECAPVLPPDVLDRLRHFNRSRIEAVHKYLLGGTDYATLKQACDDSTGIDAAVYDFVIAKVGRPVASAQGQIGEFIVRRGTKPGTAPDRGGPG